MHKGSAKHQSQALAVVTRATDQSITRSFDQQVEERVVGRRDCSTEARLFRATRFFAGEVLCLVQQVPRKAHAFAAT